MSRIAIRNIGQLVTMAGPSFNEFGGPQSSFECLKDGVIHIDGDSIAYAGPSNLAPLFAHHEEIDAQGCVVTPGLVDAHTHAVFAGNRADEFEERARGATYQDIAAKGGGILSTVRKTRAATEGELYKESKKHAEWMIRCGTTTAEIKSGYGLDLESELKMLRVAKQLQKTGLSVVRTFLGAHAVPPEAGSKADYLDHVLNDMLPAVAKECEFVDMFVEDKYFSHDDARRLAEKARAFKLGLRLHVDQLRDGKGAELACSLQADTADHLEYTSAEGFAYLDHGKTIPILLPASVYGIRSDKYPDAKALYEAGLRPVIATDFNPGSSPSPSLPFCMSLAVTKMGMSVEEALASCTIRAAKSLNRGDKFGSLEPGKAADLVIWDFNDYRELGYWVGYTPIQRVIKFGQTIYL